MKKQNLQAVEQLLNLCFREQESSELLEDIKRLCRNYIVSGGGFAVVRFREFLRSLLGFLDSQEIRTSLLLAEINEELERKRM